MLSTLRLISPLHRNAELRARSEVAFQQRAERIQKLSDHLSPNERGKVQHAGLIDETIPKEHPTRRENTEKHGPMSRYYYYDQAKDAAYVELMKLKEEPVVVSVAPSGYVYTTYFSEPMGMKNHPHYRRPSYEETGPIHSPYLTDSKAKQVSSVNIHHKPDLEVRFTMSADEYQMVMDELLPKHGVIPVDKHPVIKEHYRERCEQVDKERLAETKRSMSVASEIAGIRDIAERQAESFDITGARNSRREHLGSKNESTEPAETEPQSPAF